MEEEENKLQRPQPISTLKEDNKLINTTTWIEKQLNKQYTAPHIQ